MSLLLEALKKAELAKQQQAAQQVGAEDTTLPITGTRSTDQLRETPRLEPLAVTRDRLPEVDAPLELVPDQIPAGDPSRGSPLDLALTDSLPQSSGPAKAVAARAAVAASAAAGARADAKEARPRSWTQDTADDREAARRVFESKTPDYNPRRPFYVALGVLGLVAAGALGYFWWELQPSSTFTSASVKSGPRPVATAPSVAKPPAGAAPTTTGAPVTESPAAPQINVATAPAPGVASTAPTDPDAVPTPAARVTEAAPSPAALAETPRREAPAPALAPRPQSAAPQPPQPRLVTPQTAAQTRAAASTGEARVAVRPTTPTTPPRPSGVITNASESNAESSIRVNRAVPRLDPVIEEAYGAFQAGDVDRARQLYLRAAQSDPLNRDVQLGLAAVDLRERNLGGAEARYMRLLELDPRDPHALAGLTAIRGGADPVTTESRLKSLISQQPDSGLLHFALGNQLAAQARWSEAQLAYFKAFTSDPENPDFAFNLAVSLDNIRQTRLATDYYKQALALAERRPAAFDRSRVSARMQELQR